MDWTSFSLENNYQFKGKDLSSFMINDGHYTERAKDFALYKIYNAIERINYFESLPEKGSILKEKEKLEKYKAEYKKITGFNLMEVFPVVEFKYAANRIFQWINMNTDTYSMFEVVNIVGSGTKYDNTRGMIVDFSDDSDSPLNKRTFKVKTNDGEFVDINHKNFRDSNHMEVQSSFRHSRTRSNIWDAYYSVPIGKSRWGYDHNRIWKEV